MIGSIVGGLFGRNQAKKAYSGMNYSPFNVNTGYGNVDFKGNKATASLSPEYQEFVNNLLGTAASGMSNYSPYQGNENISLFGQQAMDMALNPDMQGLSDEEKNAMQAFGQGIDPTAVANEQFGRYMDVLRPQQEREQLSMESRLFNQGLLGSTAGGERFRALNEAQNAQENQLMAQAMQQGMDVAGMNMNLLGQAAQLGGMQRQLESPERQLGIMDMAGRLGMGAEEFQQAMQDKNFATALSSLSAALGLEGMATDLIGLGGQLGSWQSAANSNAFNSSGMRQANEGLSNIFGNAVSGIVGGIFG